MKKEQSSRLAIVIQENNILIVRENVFSISPLDYLNATLTFSIVNYLLSVVSSSNLSIARLG